MTIDELEALVREAAADHVARTARPVTPAVVLPGPSATTVTALDGFPDDDRARFDYLSRLAAERIRPAGVPCYGFIAEATLDTGAPSKDFVSKDVPSKDVVSEDVVVVVYGARRHRPRIMAAPFVDRGGVGDETLDAFTDSEALDPTAMPFLSPLQHAVDAAEPPDVTGGVLP